MKHARFTLLLSALMILISSFSFAQPGKRRHAHRAIRRTAVVLVYAHKQVKENKNFTGDLARAVRHQRYARFLFKQGHFARAIHHSRRARLLAFSSINANKGVVQKDWEPNKDEYGNKADAEDSNLEKELPKNSEGLTDEQLIMQELTDVDLAEAAANDK